jgi:O-antigen/teichoic acid export membrane protein
MTSIAVTPFAPSRAATLAGRFFGYLSADGLNYALGFVIYGWLIRVLSNQQYGQLSIATSFYQALMLVAALGLDLTGPKLIAECGDALQFAQKAQRLRLIVALVVCAPLQIGAATFAWNRGHNLLAIIIIASFSMVAARALDLSYLAVALRSPAPLAKTRALGLFAYMLMLVACTPVIRQHLWLVPILNAVGLTLGRLQLGRMLRRSAPPTHPSCQVAVSEIITQGMKAGGGQLLILLMQTGDVMLLARYVSADAVGQYAMISRLYLLGTAVLVAMLNTFLPEIVGALTSVVHLRRHFRTFFAANLVLGVAGWACFRLLASPLAEMLAHRPLPWVHIISPAFALVFLMLAVANPFLSMLPSLHRATEYVAAIASALALLLVWDILFVPAHGVIAAAYGQVLATGYLALFCAIVYWRHMQGLQDEVPPEDDSTLRLAAGV